MEAAGMDAATDATPSESLDESLDHSEETADETLEQDLSDDADESQGERNPKKTKDSKKPQAKKTDDADELEEIAIGSLKTKLPKSVAKAIKDLERGSQAKMQEAAAERKKITALLDMAKNDPDRFFELTGIDADEFAESRLARKYERQLMTPEQRELADLKAEKERREQMEMQSKSEIISELEEIVGSKAPNEIKQLPKEKLMEILESQRAQATQEQQSLDTEMGEAWKESGLPKHKYFVQFMAATMLQHQRRTKEPLHAKEAAAIVKRDFLQSVSDIFDAMDPQGILDAIGAKTESKIREHLIARATGRTPASKATQAERPGSQPASQKIQRTKPMNEFEYREYLKSLQRDLRD